VPAIREIAGVKDHGCSLMAELGHSARFAHKSVCDVGVPGEFRFDNLHSYRPLQPKVQGAIDSAHATGADFAFDPKPASDKLRDVHN
jgi:hypothetical protein